MQSQKAEFRKQFYKQLKNKIMKTKILSLLIVAFFLVSTTLLAQSKKERNQWTKKPEQKEMMQKRFARQMGEQQKFFTEEQKETMQSLRLETAKKVKPFKNELRELAAHQKTLTTADKADLKAINKNIEKISDAKTEIAKIMAAQHQKVRSLLSEEQLLKFDIMKKKHGQKRGKDFGRNNRGQKSKMHLKGNA